MSTEREWRIMSVVTFNRARSSSSPPMINDRLVSMENIHTVVNVTGNSLSPFAISQSMLSCGKRTIR